LKMSKIMTCALVLALFVSIGCTKAIDSFMVIGTYKANHGKGSDVLQLQADGIYLYRYTSADGNELNNTSKWEFEYRDGKPTIAFSRFVFGLPGYREKGPGFWIVEVEKSIIGNTIHLCLDPDLGYFYDKQD